MRKFLTAATLAGLLILAARPAPGRECSPAPALGQNRALVILINFSDQTPTYTKAEFEDRFFGAGESTVRDYYQTNSFDQFDLTGEVEGWFTANNTHNYFANNYYGRGGARKYPANAEALAAQAIDLAEAAGVDFSRYDNSGDGCVDSLIIVHQGRGGERIRDPTNIWSYLGALTDGGAAARFYDGVWIDKFVIVPEVSYRGDRMIEAGPPAHEYGHALGLIDLYDKDNSSAGFGIFDLMSAGVWGGDQESPELPVNLSAFIRIQLGWLTPLPVTGSNQGRFVIPALEDAPFALKVPADPRHPEEYFLVANLEPKGYDRRLPGRGILIAHADDRGLLENRDELIGGGYFVPILSLEQADGRYDLEHNVNLGDSTDFFPRPDFGARDFHSATVPDSLNHGCRLSGVSITAIGNPGDTVAVQVRTDDFRARVPWPDLQLEALTWTEVAGDGDAHLEADEEFIARLTLANNGATAHGLRAALDSDSPFLLLGDTVLAFPDLGPGQTASAAEPLLLTVLPGYTPGLPQTVFINAVHDGGTAGFSEDLRLGHPDLLYVDDDGGAFTEREVGYYLADRGYYFDQWEVKGRGTPPAAELLKYRRVLWVTGPVDVAPLADPELAALEAFLNGGGKLALSSPYLLVEPSPAAATFAADYLHVAGWTDDRYAMDWVTGVADDPVSHNPALVDYQPMLFYYPNFNRTVGLTPAADAAGCLTNDRGHFTCSRSPAAPTGSSASVFLSFGLETLSRPNLPQLLRRAVNSLNYVAGRPWAVQFYAETGRPKQVNILNYVYGLNFTAATDFTFPDNEIKIYLKRYINANLFQLNLNVSLYARPGWHDLLITAADGATVRIENLYQVAGEPMPNQVPVAKAGADDSGYRSKVFVLNGAGSYDPDYDPLTYEWQRLEGPAVTILPSAAARVATFTPAPNYCGPYLFRLQVMDPWDAAGDTVRITVLNHPPTAMAGPDREGDRSAVFMLDGAGSADVDHDPLRYQWTLRQGPAVSLLPSDTAATVFFSPAPHFVGAYVFELSAADAWDAAGDTVRVTVENHPPTAVTGPDQIGAVGVLVTLDGSASYDLDGDTIGYLWTQTQGPPVSLEASDPSRPTFVPPAAGNYIFSLQCQDPFEIGPNSAASEVIVTSSGNHPPLADAGDDQSVSFDEVLTVYLDGRESADQDGDTLSYHWVLLTQPAGSHAELDDPASPTPTFPLEEPGQYLVSLRVFDGEVWGTADFLTVTAVLKDCDGDGIPDYLDLDDDNDLMPDAWELAHGLNPLDLADGDPAVLSPITDPDGDGNANIHEFVNGADPRLADARLCGAALGGCFFGDGNGNFLFDPEDFFRLQHKIIVPADNLPAIYPGSGDGLDLTGNGVIDPADVILLKSRIISLETPVRGAPALLALLAPGATVTVRVGDTVRIAVAVLDDPAGSDGFATPRSGAAVLFELAQGAGVILGGEAPLPARHTLAPLTVVNSSYHESTFTLAQDEKEIIVSSNRGPFSAGDFDLYSSRRADLNQPFGPLQPIAAVNETTDEASPSLSADGLTLYFSRVIPDASWDLYRATRPDRASPFGTPAPLSELNTSGADYGPSITGDGLTLYFGQYASPGGYGLYRATRPDLASPFGPPQPVSELNTNYYEALPSVNAADTKIYFFSNRPSAHPGYNLWSAERPTPAEPFSAPQELALVNTDLSEYEAFESPDGKRLYFSAFSYGDGDDVDIFLVRRPSLSLPFFVSERPGRYEVTGAMGLDSSPDSGGRAQVLVRPLACGTLAVAVFADADVIRGYPSFSLPGFIQLNVTCP